jgi:hypothetical protein
MNGRSRLPLSWKRRVLRTIRWWRAAEPSARVLARSTNAEAPPLAVVCVYRTRNAQVVLDLVRGAGPGATIRLWALEEIAPALAEWTIGSGPGLRTALLNRCIAALPDDHRGFVAICDDDAAFSQGNLAVTAATARAARLSLSQPAHDTHSLNSHRLNEARPWSRARLTTFVEVGPVLLVHDEAPALVLPMDESFGMGSGLEIEWMREARRNADFRLGVVDLTRVRHLGPPGAEYDLEGGLSSFRTGLEEMGGYRHALQTLATWRVWQRRPPW